MLASCAGLEKSEHVLSPTVAGPIPGVFIEQPRPLEPKDGRNIEVASQPITLLLENSPNNSQRPIAYLFEIATDNAFNTKVFTRAGVTSGEGGRTSLRLPEALATGRTYYWRAQAADGANTGPYSGPAHFNIFTQVVIDRPVLLQPVNNAQLDSVLPRFLIGNAPRSGPVGALSYQIEVADGDSFANKHVVWTVGEQPTQTRLDAPSGLPSGKQLFWRARAYDTTGAAGDWSASAAFRTAAVTVPTPTPGTGGSCASRGTPLEILQCRRNQYGAHMNATEIVAFLKASAKDINTLATVGGPWGTLVKTSGSQCNGYSCDILCLGNGSGQIQRDVLIDAEGSQTPIWGGPLSGSGIAVRQCEAQ
ncbi:MAG: hypothetical protein A3H97_16750 [Acidobacteria bacterium RIFCSPLOWO2_02_FULL_65_29]|nr:MAG: hypothetical protein A3H97_16750 [Acidobacteria bacterium RIFCSPLOWO2_02_FULL_65_29]